MTLTNGMDNEKSLWYIKSWLTSLAHCSADQLTRLKFHPVGEFSAEISILAIMFVPFAVNFCISYIYYLTILNKLLTIAFSTHLSWFLFYQNVGLLESLLFFFRPSSLYFGVHSIKTWVANVRHRVTWKRKRQREKHLRKLMKKSSKIKGAY